MDSFALFRYRKTAFLSLAGTFLPLSLPQNRFFLSGGHLSPSFVTAKRFFPLWRAPFFLFRYRETDFSSLAGTFLPLSLPRNRFFLSSGHLSPSFVTAKPVFPLLRAPFSLFRYRETAFLARAGTFLSLWLPRNCFFLSSGHLFPSFVTAKPLFPLGRAPFSLFGYHKTFFSSLTGTFLPLSLPQNRFFLSGGHLSLSLVTAKPLFPLGRAPFSLFGYHETAFSSRAGTFFPLSLPRNRFFLSGGHLSLSLVTAKPLFPL
ncbi:hypothetical protein P9D39_03020 [Heyndrickxia oleronia]|nr:hypothetical protein [Heyndrickxia oleronia]MEC1373281.1 hypothetical protein [Heyndrickxia oleronia]QQZ04418.1 hypothetical protein I5818_22525 [Heyndrickxia oleronia]